jgi:hypothetical protein
MHFLETDAMRFAAITLATFVCFGSAAFAADDPNVLFSDDFSTLDPAWGEANDQISVADGKMVFKPKVNDGYSLLYQGTTFGDVDIRVKVTQTAGPVAAGSEASVVFWGVDYDNFYMAAIQTDGSFGVPRNVADKWLHPVAWKANDAVKKGLNTVNELRIVIKGKTATIYVNDQQVASFKGFPPEGASQIGLHAESGDQACTWKFSDFVVRKAQ